MNPFDHKKTSLHIPATLGYDSPSDPQMTLITVEHLLRHTAGWDETAGPVYDPMMNSLLVGLGREVVDIAQEMQVRMGIWDV